MRHELAKVKDLFDKLNYMLSKQQKQYGLMVLICTALAAALETLGVSAIMPVVEALTSVDTLKDKWYLGPFAARFQDNPSMLVSIVCGGTIAIYLLKNIYFIFYTWLVRKYTHKIKRELGTRVMESYMAQGYIFFVNNNSGKLLQGITGDITEVNNVLNKIFTLISKVLTILVIGIFILVQDPFVAIFLLVLAGGCVLAIQLFYKKPAKKYGETLRYAAAENNRACLEMIQGSKEVLVTGRQDYFKQKYVDSIVKYNKCNIKIETAAIIPAYIIEAVCITGLLLAVAVQVSMEGASTDRIKTLSVIAVAAFRILPSVGTITSELNSIRSSMPSFNAAYLTIRKVSEMEKELAQKQTTVTEEKYGEIKLNRELTINHVYYRYPASDQYILQDVSLRIKAKSSVGIIGSSGAGKSTFVDVLLGLLEPESGEILLDGTPTTSLGNNWKRNIGYVPQSIYLVDEDIRANIAFGVAREEIVDDQVWRALDMAQLSAFVKAQPDGLDSRVGEWGVKFSGGQRQRVAIARALYSNPEILVLDEATAALDNETENALMEAIDALVGHKTLIVVAHRLTTIRRCDHIYEVKDGKLIERSKEEVLA